MKGLQPGEHSPIEAAPYKRNENGQRVRVANRRQATLWRARCQYRAEDGTRIDVTRWARTQREAIAAVEGAIEEYQSADTSTDDSVLSLSSPFTDAGAAWLDWIERPEARPSRGGLSRETKRIYTSLYTRHLVGPGSPLRGRTIAQVNDPQRLILFLQGIADTKGTETAKMCRSVLSSILNLCLRRGVIKMNVARTIGAVSSVKPTDTGRDRSRAFTRKERDEVLAKADEKATEATHPRTIRKWQLTADTIAFMAGTGCRISEARLLQWPDLDLKQRRVRIRGTKTSGSDRMNNLPVWLAKRLKKRRELMKQWEHPTPYVFSMGRPREVVLPNGLRTFPGDNVPVDATNLAHWIRDVLDDAGFPWAIPHTFRRTAATLLHEAGIPLAAISDQLGHADPSMTMSVYLGRDLDGDKSANAAVL
ncbi:MAG: site-specific integrase [Propionibacteriaceae bacterium]|nr:site-specific integrase [Propionibacteriaceae bacterium]